MPYQLTPFMFIYALIFLLSLSLGSFAALRYLRHDRRLEILAFTIMMVGICSWELLDFFVDVHTDVQFKMLSKNLSNVISVPLFMYSLLGFVLSYTDNERWLKLVVTAFIIHVVGLGVTLFVSPHFLYTPKGLVSQGPFTMLGLTIEQYVLLDRELHTPFVIYQLYSYCIALCIAVILVRYLYRKRYELYTGQIITILIGTFAPTVTSGLLFLGVVPPWLNPLDLALGVTAISFAIALFRYELFQIIPVGRQQLFEILSDPVVVLDDENRVVDANTSARQIFDSGTDYVGVPATTFFQSLATDVRTQLIDGHDLDTELTVETDGKPRHFSVSATSIGSQPEQGRILAFRDITTQKTQQEQLRRQNERLNDFASMISHDLRNPLNVVQGHLEHVRDDVPEENFEQMKNSITRMETMIDDLLTMARAGQTVEETEEVSLGGLTREAWNHVETDQATLTLSVPDDVTLEADGDRLLQVFENLFRNAVDHNDRPVTVRVGVIDATGTDSGHDQLSGFFVEDDGDGIPEDAHTDIFEAGYTTSDDGTGFGLSIVQDIVRAHDWEIRETNGGDGGARFEITGVTFLVSDVMERSPKAT